MNWRDYDIPCSDCGHREGDHSSIGHVSSGGSHSATSCWKCRHQNKMCPREQACCGFGIVRSGSHMVTFHQWPIAGDDDGVLAIAVDADVHHYGVIIDDRGVVTACDVVCEHQPAERGSYMTTGLRRPEAQVHAEIELCDAGQYVGYCRVRDELVARAIAYEREELEDERQREEDDRYEFERIIGEHPEWTRR